MNLALFEASEAASEDEEEEVEAEVFWSRLRRVGMEVLLTKG